MRHSERFVLYSKAVGESELASDCGDMNLIDRLCLTSAATSTGTLRGAGVCAAKTRPLANRGFCQRNRFVIALFVLG
ncbi:hypothetical protein AXG93_1040s1350 [Marchantia polymorpha subsp. ruderalis]|uniref:Uncharacterized protein n=1 Tax=Marchantia polymorpha subsp. ruderalis TaxID=1480154 RepID=A0A176VGL7_MARPO|nr:hypothetical protein AXG93_1040s1350 [Marchantia polymorpha subsp. ruderalis]